MTKAQAQREDKLRSLTDQIRYFDPSNPIHLAHYNALKVEFGEMAAAMLVSQDAALTAQDYQMELTDPGEIASHPGWRALNRVVRHGEKARYTIFDFDADTKAGGRIVRLFTRDQTVPAYAQQDDDATADRMTMTVTPSGRRKIRAAAARNGKQATAEITPDFERGLEIGEALSIAIIEYQRGNVISDEQRKLIEDYGDPGYVFSQ